MASFSAGTTFTDGVANDVTAAKLAALVNAATPTSGFIQDRTAETTIAADDTLLFGDFSDSNNLKRMTVANFAGTLPTATITSGTITTLNSTTGTITTGVIPTLTSTTLITTGTGTAASPAIVPTGDTNTGIFFPAADTIAFSEGGAESMRIDSSGNVGIGNTNPATLLETATYGKGLAVGSTSDSASNITIVSSPTSTLATLKFGDGGSGVYDQGYLIYDHTNNSMLIGTNRAERLRIDSSGNVLVGAASGQSSERLLAQNDSATNPSFIAYSPSATFTGYVARLFADRNTSNSSYNFLSCVRVATAGDVFIIRDSGNAVNTNNSYGAISDIKLKENIEDAASQWNDIKSIQVRKFSFKNDEEHKRMLGLVAQEVELISPNLVETVIDKDKDGSDLGTTTKEVKYSVLYMKAVKALQEAMGRIEQLESKVTALEAA